MSAKYPGHGATLSAKHIRQNTFCCDIYVPDIAGWTVIEGAVKGRCLMTGAFSSSLAQDAQELPSPQG